MKCKLQITRLLVGLVLALSLTAQGFAQSPGGRASAACEGAGLKEQASRFTELDAPARAEERAEALRANLLDLQMQEIDLQAQVEDLDYRSTPESIQRALAFVGSPRPMDELRDTLRTRLEKEKARVNRQLELLASKRARLEAAISRADAEVERLRQPSSLP